MHSSLSLVMWIQNKNAKYTISLAYGSFANAAAIAFPEIDEFQNPKNWLNLL